MNYFNACFPIVCSVFFIYTVYMYLNVEIFKFSVQVIIVLLQSDKNQCSPKSKEYKTHNWKDRTEIIHEILRFFENSFITTKMKQRKTQKQKVHRNDQKKKTKVNSVFE